MAYNCKVVDYPKGQHVSIYSRASSEISPDLHSYLADLVKVKEYEEGLKNQMIEILDNRYPGE